MELCPPVSLGTVKTPIHSSSWWDETKRILLVLTDSTEVCLKFHLLKLPEGCHHSDGPLEPPRTIDITIDHISATLDDGEDVRKPIFARLSLDEEWMALQYSDTLLLIMPCNNDKDSSRHQWWTIDLVAQRSGYPVFTTIKKKPAGETAPRSAVGGDSQSISSSSSPTAATTPAAVSHGRASFRFSISPSPDASGPPTILENGIVWSDHGGNSQDLALVTTKSVVFYKVSKQRNSMSKTHTYGHTAAQKVWWEPVSRCLMVAYPGGNHKKKDNKKPPILRAYFLHHPPKRSETQHQPAFPRLELPQPDRSKLFGHVDSVESMFLVRAYDQPYFLEVAPEGGVTIRRLSREEQTNQHMVHYSALDLPRRRPEEDPPMMFASVVDDVICLVLRRATLVIDMKDEENCVLLKKGTEDDCFSSSLRFLSPCFMQSIKGTNAIHNVRLDLEKIQRGFQPERCAVPFLQRRRVHSERAHELILRSLITLVEKRWAQAGLATEATSDETTQAKCQQWIDDVADSYDTKIESLDWSLSKNLSFRSAFLPFGAEFRHQRMLSAPRSNIEHRLADYPFVLTQTEIVRSALIPLARRALVASSDDNLLVVLHLTMDLVEAFHRRSISVIPAIECLLVSLLWRFGYRTEVLACLRSRERHYRRQGQIKSYKREANDLLTDMIFAIIRQIEPGCGAQQPTTSATRIASRDQRELERQMLACLVCTSSPEIVAGVMLDQGRLCDAMTICTKAVHRRMESSRDVDDPERLIAAASPFPTHLWGERFFQAAVRWAANCRDTATAEEKYRLFSHVHNFLLLWDPRSLQLQRRHVVTPKSISLCDFYRRGWHVPRRPSAPIIAITSKAEVGEVQSRLAHNVPTTGLTEQVREMFGYRKITMS